MRAILLCLLAIIIIQGCGSESEEEKPINLVDVEPQADGGLLFLGSSVILSFDYKPSMVIVNDMILSEAKPIYIYDKDEIVGIASYIVYFNVDRFISKPGLITFIVTWTDSVGVKSSTILNYQAIERCCLLELMGSDPGNKAINVDAMRLNKEGIRFLFSGIIYIEELTVRITANNKELQWKISQDPMNPSLILLFPLPGNELGFGQEVVVRLGNVTDHVGNPYEPDGTLELHFTTAEENYIIKMVLK